MPLSTDILAHRYLYYILAAPVLSDFDYDVLEKRAVAELPADHPVHKPGSDLAKDYPDHVIERALMLHRLAFQVSPEDHKHDDHFGA